MNNLPLERTLGFKISEKLEVTSLQWFAAQTSTFTQQKYGLFYPKFSAEFNEFGLSVSKLEEEAKKYMKWKQSGENAYMRLSKAKG